MMTCWLVLVVWVWEGL